MLNSANTSPTYSDTPAWISLGKYIVMYSAMFFYTLVLFLRRKRVGSLNIFFFLSLFYLSIVPIIYGAFLGSLAFVELGVVLALAVHLGLFGASALDWQRVSRILSWGVFAAIFVDILQVFLFIIYGRLPALAYADSISVRFGSFLDDPNGFGLLIAIFLGFSTIYYGGLLRVVVFGLLLVALLLTQSLTAIISVLVAFIPFISVFLRGRPRRLILFWSALTVFFLSLAALLSLNYATVSGIFMAYMQTKEGSIDTHLDSFATLHAMTFIRLIGLDPADQWGESGYVNLLGSFGIPYLLFYGSVHLYGAYFCFKKLVSTDSSWSAERAFWSAGYFFLAAISVANLNLPVGVIYPVNMLGAIFLGVVASTGRRPMNCKNELGSLKNAVDGV